MTSQAHLNPSVHLGQSKLRLPPFMTTQLCVSYLETTFAPKSLHQGGLFNQGQGRQQNSLCFHPSPARWHCFTRQSGRGHRKGTLWLVFIPLGLHLEEGFTGQEFINTRACTKVKDADCCGAHSTGNSSFHCFKICFIEV